MTTRGRSLTVAALALVAAVACAIVWAVGPAAASTRVALAPIVAAWPDSYTVAGQKSEPLYTEQIRVTRAGDEFAVRIDVNSQGSAALGTQHSIVVVAPSGTITWTQGCTKTADLCAADTSLRGFLTTAAVLGLARTGLLPDEATARDLHGTTVVCVDDRELHPDAPLAPVRLDPCFDELTGAVLAHWSPDSRAFVGATLAEGFTITQAADPTLLQTADPTLLQSGTR